MLEGLSEKGVRLWSSIIGMAKQGLSATKALLTLRKEGLGYRESVFRRDYRIARVAADDWSGMKYLSGTDVIHEEYYKTAKGALKDNYMTRFEVEIELKDTGEREKRYITVGHKTLRSREELEEEVVGRLYEQGDRYDFDIEESRIIRITPIKAIKSPSLSA
ncbi:MAG: hypothetical protein ACTSYJ_06300 [Candidatus Thorarchaeota archaeon]